MSPAVNTHPDLHYLRHPLEMLRYNDAVYANLVSNVPNYYYGGGWDSTFYGTALRGVAGEQAHLEFCFHYDMLSRSPQALTPPDARRRFSDVLYINKNYPGLGQWDTDYTKMVVALRDAYRKGSTVGSIGDVIRAYTGETFYIEELFKFIGTPSIDETDRNSLKISVHAGGDTLIYSDANKAQLANETERIRALTDDLYHAIDLAKPAHVGINLTTIFGLDEDIGQFLSPRDANGVGILDELRIFVVLEEGEPGDPMLHHLRHLPTTPDTGLHSIYKTPFGVYYQWFRTYMGLTTEIVGATNPYLTLTYKELPASPLEFNLSSDGARFFCVTTLKDDAGVPMAQEGRLISTQSFSAQLRVRPFGIPDSKVPDPALPPPPGTVSPYLIIHYQPSSMVAQQPDPNTPLAVSTVTLQATANHRLPTPGLLHPRLNRVWEIQSDEFMGSDIE